MSRIFAVDPGTEKSGWCLLDSGRVVESGVCGNHEIIERLWISEIDVFAVEMVASYGMAVGREVFETCVWIGRFIETWDRRCCSLDEMHRLIYRKDVKLHLCGNSRAKDANIRQALIDLYGPGKDKAIGKKAMPGPLYGVSSHAWAALAVAVTVEAQGKPEAIAA